MPQRTLTIACLGWGSLRWDPRGLPIRGTWFDDGPLLAIEFERESSNGRITLVLCNVSYRVCTYWALMGAVDLGTAKNDLAAREGVKKKDIEKSIGFWEAASGKSYGAAANDVGQWAATK